MHNSPDLIKLQGVSLDIRETIVEMAHRSKAAHIGSALSCVDILSALYWFAMAIDPKDANNPGRDRFILSKGHAAKALFATLATRGFFPLEQLESFAQSNSCLEEHPGPYCAPGVEAATGSLGHGLPIGLGFALAGRIKKLDYKVFVLLGDGECNEGSVWEAAMFAAAHKLKNVCVIVDFNKWQATARSCETMAIEPLAAKWESFGWKTCEINGHDMAEIVAALGRFPDESRPTAIIAHTVKGRGVSFMEDDNNWHYRSPNADELARARQELESARKALSLTGSEGRRT